MGIVDKVRAMFSGGPSLALDVDGPAPIGGRVSGRVVLTGGRRATNVTVRVRLVRVRTQDRDGAAGPEIKREAIVELTIAANRALPPRAEQELPLTIPVPLGAPPSTGELGYQVEVEAEGERGWSSRLSTEATIVDPTRARFGGSGVFGRWPALRDGSRESATIDALREIGWEHNAEVSRTDLAGLEPVVARFVEEGTSGVRRAALATWSALVEGRGEREHLAVLRSVVANPDTETPVLKEAAEVAAKLHGCGGGDVLRELAEHDEADVRRAVVTATRLLPAGSRLGKRLLQVLSADAAIGVRAAAVRALSPFDDDEAVVAEVARHAKQETAPEVLRECIAVLRGAYFKGAADVVRPVFEQLTRHPQLQVRKALASSIYFAEIDTDAVAIVEALLRDESAEVRGTAAAGVVRLPKVGKRLLGRLQEMARDDPEPVARRGALASLPQFVDAGAHARELDALLEQQPDVEVQLGMVEGIAYRDEGPYTALLHRLAQSSKTQVAAAAQASLRRRGQSPG